VEKIKMQEVFRISDTLDIPPGQEWKRHEWRKTVIHLDQSDREPSNAETWIFLIGCADGIIQSNGLDGDHRTD